MNETTEIVESNNVSSQKHLQVMEQNQTPVTVDELLKQVTFIQSIMKSVMREGEHFGKIPGCGDKPALLKPGAEKLGHTFRLKPEFHVTRIDHGNIGHREYQIICHLSNGTEGVGACSTLESKYRYRDANRVCPNCGKEAIIKGKEEYGGGWLCFAKKGGCGSKWQTGEQEIEGQKVGRIEHDNPADYYNTCLKMAKKRAHVDAILTATAASDIFAQDIEEMAEPAGKEAPTSFRQDSWHNPGDAVKPEVTKFDEKPFAGGKPGDVMVTAVGPIVGYPAKIMPQNALKQSQDEPKEIGVLHTNTSEFTHLLDQMIEWAAAMNKGSLKEAERMILDASTFPNKEGKKIKANDFSHLKKSEKWTRSTHGKIKKAWENWNQNLPIDSPNDAIES